MLKAMCVTMSIVLLAILPASVLAAPAGQGSEGGWQAQYWNNRTLSGTPLLQRNETGIDYNWGASSPVPDEINGDNFSARWTRTIQVTAGTYRFTAISDDGVRVWVDEQLIIDGWSDHPAKTYTVDRALAAGSHAVRVEYYEHTGEARVSFSWSLTQNAIVNWRGEYWNNKNQSGAPAVVRDDAAISFDWGTGSPVPGVIGTDNFSVRWTRNLDLPAGWTAFTLRVDDGARLWVNNQLVIDHWVDQPATTYTAQVNLPGGVVPVRLDYYESGVQAVAQLSWMQSSETRTVVVDVDDPGFQYGGSPTGWHRAAYGYNGNMLWTLNNDYARPAYNWAHWHPQLTAGRYEVFAYIPAYYATTHAAQYWVVHADGYTLRVVDQMRYSNEWVSLGTYNFTGTADDRVSLSDVTGETRLSHSIGFDAIKWEPR
jgi:hypothetical protein